MARPEKSSRPILYAHKFIFRDSDAAILACGSLDRNRTDVHNAFIMMTDGTSCTLDLFSPDAGGDDRAPASTEALLQTTVETCYRRAEIHFQRRFEPPRPPLSLRGVAAAVAHTHRNVIRFNRRLFERNTADFLRHTIPHEVSHLLAYRLHGRGIAPHGDEWAAIMREVFGLTPTRCHQYD